MINNSKLSRRNLLLGAASVGTGLAATRLNGSSSQSTLQLKEKTKGSTFRMAELNKETFLTFVNRNFKLYVEGQSIDVELFEIEDVKIVPQVEGQNLSEIRQEPFTLIFKAPLDVQLPQQNYRLEHKDLGALTIFMTPIQPSQDAQYLQALFS